MILPEKERWGLGLPREPGEGDRPRALGRPRPTRLAPGLADAPSMMGTEREPPGRSLLALTPGDLPAKAAGKGEGEFRVSETAD
jgi:hypothetical protein